MKKILMFILLLYSVSFCQFRVIGDTTDLKMTYGSGMVFLEQFGKGSVNGGGLFHRIDSTYAEGIHAFDYPVNGFQWARISLIDQYLDLSSGQYQVPVWNTNKYSPMDIAGIDSFYTTSAIDTIRIVGVAAGDIFIFNEYRTSVSDPIDTVLFSYRAKQDTVFVTRTTPLNTNSYKSGGKYSYLRLK